MFGQKEKKRKKQVKWSHVSLTEAFDDECCAMGLPYKCQQQILGLKRQKTETKKFKRLGLFYFFIWSPMFK